MKNRKNLINTKLKHLENFENQNVELIKNLKNQKLAIHYKTEKTIKILNEREEIWSKIRVLDKEISQNKDAKTEPSKSWFDLFDRIEEQNKEINGELTALHSDIKKKIEKQKAGKKMLNAYKPARTDIPEHIFEIG